MLTGREQRFHPDYSALERAYIAVLGVPVVGLRIRTRNLLNLVPAELRPERVLDAGSGPGVITFALARRFPTADVLGMDLSDEQIAASRAIAERAGFRNVRFVVGDLREPVETGFGLVCCVDILEHIEDDRAGIAGLYRALRPGGTLVLHVPSKYRRYPVWKKAVNFDVPTHVRPGYTVDEIVGKVRAAGFEIADHGLTYGFLETFANNVSYMITRARKQNRQVYALAFPVLNALGWLGRHAKPRDIGAGVYLVCRRPKSQKESER